MSLELVVRYLGYGERCSSCGKTRETTRFTIRQGNTLLQQYLLCDSCQDKGHIIKFDPKRISSYSKAQLRKRLKISRKLEEGVAADIGGHTTSGSGNKDEKSDIRCIDDWRLEHKFTDSTHGYRIEVSALDAVIRHGNMTGEKPGLVFNLRRLGRSFVVLPYEVFLEMVEDLRGRTNKNRTLKGLPS